MSYFIKHRDEHGEWFLTDRGDWSDDYSTARLFAIEREANAEAARRAVAINRVRLFCDKVKVRATNTSKG